MTEVLQFAAFVVATTYDDLSPEARQALKIRAADSLDSLVRKSWCN